MNNIELKGSKTYLTLNANYSFKVVAGTVLVYAASIEAGQLGRRTFIAQVGQNEYIPAMYINNQDIGEWTFILSAMGEAVIEENPEVSDELILDFAGRINLKLFEAEEFAAEIVERVNLKLITEEGYIYAVSEEQKATYEKSLSIIYSLFGKKRKKIKTEESGYLLYDTVAYLCDNMEIKIAPFDVLRDSCGRRFTLEDISRISHFISRDVLLEENWHKKDSGPLIAYMLQDNKPVVCLPKGINKYVMYDCETKETIPLTKEVAEKLNPRAKMIYRPFENKALGVGDLLKFGLKFVRMSDISNLLIFSLIGTIIGLLMPFLNEKIFDSYIPMGDDQTLIQTCLLILTFAIGNLTFTIVKNLAIFRSSNGMEIGIQNAVFDRLYNMPSSFYSKYESADLSNRALGISAIFKSLSETAITVTLSAVFSLLYLFRMFGYSDNLTWIGIALILVNMLVTFGIGWLKIKHEKQLVELNSKISSLMYQILNGIAKIRIAGVENRALLQYLEPYVESRRIYVKKERLANLAANFNLFLGVLFTVVFYYMMVSQGLGISFGEFMGFTAAFGAFSGAMISVVSAFLQVNSVIPVYNRAKDILNTPQEYEEDSVVPGKLAGKIEVSNLSFRYSEEGEMILKDIGFSINPGEYIGIVGSSGSGKSTLLKILLGFESPTSGRVYYDDKDIDSLDKRELRKRFGVVLQDGQLITGSIYENIIITGSNITKDRVAQVIEQVGLKKDIDAMPMGLHTVIAEGSGTISGGQRQRILIARAIVNKPNIIYFDEATSALDNVNQALVCESLEKLNATRIVVAHRLSTIMNCDRILVLENGQLIEQGSYDELMNLGGRFYDLAQRQLA